jgi:hypothetical protein
MSPAQLAAATGETGMKPSAVSPDKSTLVEVINTAVEVNTAVGGGE